MLFSENLTSLINAALADGVITVKEREVLHKRAQQEGVTPDEVDVYIDGRLQQMQNEINKAKQKIRKCPACGEIIPAMTAVCPNCGQVIDTSNQENKALKDYMDKLESTLVKFKTNPEAMKAEEAGAEVEALIRQGRSMYGNNKKIASLISEVEASLAAEKKKRQKPILIAVSGLLFLACLCFAIDQISELKEDWDREEWIEKSEAAEEPARKQYEQLMNKLDSLEEPNINNYKEIESKLMRIVWVDIPHDATRYKNTYLTKKKAIAKQIGDVVIKPEAKEERTYAENGAPKYITSPEFEIYD